MNGKAPSDRLSRGEQRALASFLAGRLPAGQLHGELCRHRAAALAKLAAREEPGAARQAAPTVPGEAPIAVPAEAPIAVPGAVLRAA
jgi:hypothetical protein